MWICVAFFVVLSNLTLCFDTCMSFAGQKFTCLNYIVFYYKVKSLVSNFFNFNCNIFVNVLKLLKGGLMENLQDIFMGNLPEKDFLEISPITLAFIGDGVHTLFVRDKVVKSGFWSGFHKKSSSLCNAKAQSIKLDQLLPILTLDEKDIVRRARNAKTQNIAKNSDVETYKKATSFEALIGYLYLKGDYARLDYILKFEKE